MSRISKDLITEIILRLPVKSLIRFKWVSKTWCSMIEDPDFIKLHLDHSLKTGSNHYLMLKDRRLFTVDFDSLTTAVEMEHHPLYAGLGGETEAIGSSNGLVLLRNSEQNLALYNFSTRTYHRLPVEPLLKFGSESDDPGSVFYGFGYDSVNDDYKVLRIVLHLFQDAEDVFWTLKSEVDVYSLKSDSWRTVDDANFHTMWLSRPFHELFFHRSYGLLAGNALHWVAPGIPNFIIGFGLGCEEFHMVPQPDYESNGFEMDLSVLAGCLCALCHYNSSCVDVWMMKEYGVEDSWTKLFKIEQPDVYNWKPLAYSKKGEDVLLLKNEEKLVWYDLRRKRTRRVRITGAPATFVAELCIGSLVPLSSNEWKEKLEQEEKERKENKKNRKRRDDFLSAGFKLVL
ncbi:putative F-box and associated interaction domains-containing protein [Tripterygium wilfordii]|uniref:Putative F-box and associated interaction domains-containing protein n=1 Tax=Tripterygium wilfordii TaxID=458696 RepID=A0A7J7C3W7_TRIWF|nr:F-box protein CPR1-like [Tripterygium wilfordii]KAF5728859.1 putative F-box and associated interaction domains-containing protein [Tripterygium wilfordii]